MLIKKHFIRVCFTSVLIAFLLYYNRTFHCNNNGETITIWTPLYDNSEAYVVQGYYWGVSEPKENYLKLYRSKYIYLCTTCEHLTINVGSYILERKGFNKVKILSHKDFFEENVGEYYENGKLLKTNKKQAESIKRISLIWGGW